jgi:hypothetical protein
MNKKAHALGVNFGFKHFGFVSLAGVEQMALSSCVVPFDFGQVASRVEQFLSG